MPALNQHGGLGTMEQVTFRITLPKKAADARHSYYISANTAYAEINVKNASSFNQNTEITCSYPTCSGTVAAPIGSDTFTVNLVGSDHTTVLSTGSATQAIIAGGNTVNLTFNPVVASIALQYDSSSWTGGASPALDPVQHTSMVLDLTATDAAGNTIVGPGSFVDANGNPITVTLSDSDASTTLSNTTFTAPGASGGTTTLAVRSGLQHASPYEDAIISVSALGVAKVKGLAVAFAPTMLNVGANAAFGTISDTYGNTATATFGCSAGSCGTQVDYNAVSGGLLTRTVPGGLVYLCAGTIADLMGGTADKMLYFVVSPGECGQPPPGGYPLPDIYEADPAAHGVTEILMSDNATGKLIDGPLGVGADGNIWYTESDFNALGVITGVHLCHYAGGSGSCTSALPGTTNVQAFMPGPGGQTIAIIGGGTGVALIDASMSVTTHDLYSQLNGTIPSTGQISSWGYSPADKQLYLWGINLATIDTNTWQVTSTTSIFPGNVGFGLAEEGASGPMTVLADGSLVTAGGNGGGYGGGVNGVIFHIHPGSSGPIVSQELPLFCGGGCTGIANASSLLPDGTITQAISSGTDIENATW